MLVISKVILLDIRVEQLTRLGPCYQTLGAIFECKTFKIPATRLAGLKHSVTSTNLDLKAGHHLSDSQSGLSRHDAVLALAWRSVMLARHKAGIVNLSNEPVLLSIGIDFRRYLNITDTYHGNGVGGVFRQTDFSTFTKLSEEYSTALAATSIRHQIKSYDISLLGDLLGWIRRTSTQFYTRLRFIGTQGTTSLFSTIYWVFDMYGVDLGKSLGHHIEVFRLPQRGVSPGWQVVLPRTPQGDYEFMISERVETMGCLMDDQFFSTSATECA